MPDEKFVKQLKEELTRRAEPNSKPRDINEQLQLILAALQDKEAHETLRQLKESSTARLQYWEKLRNDGITLKENMDDKLRIHNVSFEKDGKPIQLDKIAADYTFHANRSNDARVQLIKHFEKLDRNGLTKSDIENLAITTDDLLTGQFANSPAKKKLFDDVLKPPVPQDKAPTPHQNKKETGAVTIPKEIALAMQRNITAASEISTVSALGAPGVGIGRNLA